MLGSLSLSPLEIYCAYAWTSLDRLLWLTTHPSAWQLSLLQYLQNYITVKKNTATDYQLVVKYNPAKIEVLQQPRGERLSGKGWGKVPKVSPGRGCAV
jgi:hypothetical protein